jgi:hypothetical protein
MPSPIVKRSIRIVLNLPLHVEKGETGIIFVTSPLIRGLLIAEASEEIALRKVHEAVAELARAAS